MLQCWVFACASPFGLFQFHGCLCQPLHDSGWEITHWLESALANLMALLANRTTNPSPTASTATRRAADDERTGCLIMVAAPPINIGRRRTSNDHTANRRSWMQLRASRPDTLR